MHKKRGLGQFFDLRGVVFLRWGAWIDTLMHTMHKPILYCQNNVTSNSFPRVEERNCVQVLNFMPVSIHEFHVACMYPLR